MDELITKVCAQLNIDEAVSRKAIGQVLAFAKKNVGDDYDFTNKILSKVQGAETLVEKADEPLPPGEEGQARSTGSSAVGSIMSLIKWVLSAGPILDILKKILSTFFGEGAVKMLDSAGDSAELVGKLNNLGISREQGQSMVEMLISFLKTKLGDNVVDELTENLPALAAVLGSKKDD